MLVTPPGLLVSGARLVWAGLGLIRDQSQHSKQSEGELEPPAGVELNVILWLLKE
jgi:hypothetical protein